MYHFYWPKIPFLLIQLRETSKSIDEPTLSVLLSFGPTGRIGAFRCSTAIFKFVLIFWSVVISHGSDSRERRKISTYSGLRVQRFDLLHVFELQAERRFETWGSRRLFESYLSVSSPEKGERRDVTLIWPGLLFSLQKTRRPNPSSSHQIENWDQ